MTIIPSWLSDPHYRPDVGIYRPNLKFGPDYTPPLPTEELSHELSPPPPPASSLPVSTNQNQATNHSKKKSFVELLFNASTAIYTPPPLNIAEVLKNYPKETRFCLDKLREIQNQKTHLTKKKEALSHLGDRIDLHVRNLLVAYQQRTKEDSSLNVELHLLRELAAEIKKSRMYAPVWEKLTVGVKALFNRMVPFCLPPSEVKEDRNPQGLPNVFYHKEIVSNQTPQSSSFHGRFNDGFTYKLHLSERSNDFQSFILGDHEGNFTLQAPVLSTEGKQEIHFSNPIKEYFSYDDRANHLSDEQKKRQIQELLAIYYKKILGLFGFPVDVPIISGKNGEYFIQRTGQSKSMPEYFSHLASSRLVLTGEEKTRAEKNIVDKQLEFARSISKIFELELKFGIRVLVGSENLERLFTVRHDILYPQFTSSPLRFQLRQNIQDEQTKLRNRLIEEYGKAGLHTLADELKALVPQAEGESRTDRNFQTQLAKNSLTRELMPTLRFAVLEWFRLACMQEVVPEIFFDIKQEEVYLEVTTLARKLIQDMPREGFPRTAEFRANVLFYIQMQLTNQAHLSNRLIQQFLTFILLEENSNLSFEQAFHQFFLSDKGIFHKIGDSLKDLEDLIDPKKDKVADPAEYFLKIFWDYFINHLHYQMQSIVTTALETKLFICRNLWESARNDTERQDADTLFQSLLHSHLLAKEHYNDRQDLKGLVLSTPI